jgi:hypothetical protein
MALDVEPFVLADALAKLIGATDIRFGQTGFSKVGIGIAESRVGDGKIGIQACRQCKTR